MRKKGTYKVIPEKPLIIEYYSGDITAHDLLAQKNKIKHESGYDFQSNTIIDFRECELKIEEDELPIIFDFFKTNFQNSKPRKIGYLTSKPNQVVLAILFLKMASESGIKYLPNIFSTSKAAVNFFGSNIIKEEEFDTIIHELKNFGENTFV